MEQWVGHDGHGHTCFSASLLATGCELTTNANPLLAPVLELLAMRTCTSPGYAAAARQNFHSDTFHIMLLLSPLSPIMPTARTSHQKSVNYSLSILYELYKGIHGEDQGLTCEKGIEICLCSIIWHSLQARVHIIWASRISFKGERGRWRSKMPQGICIP